MVHLFHLVRIIWMFLPYLILPVADCAASKSSTISKFKTSVQLQLPKVYPSRAADLLRQHVSQSAMLGTCHEVSADSPLPQG